MPPAESLKGKKLGILLSTGPEHPNLPAMVALVKEAVAAEVAVYLYCIDEGVRCINNEEVQKLKEKSVNLFGCAYGAHNRFIPVDEKAAYSGLTVVSDIIANTDKFLFFG